MKISLEEKPDVLLNIPIYTLTVEPVGKRGIGKGIYHYEKLGDALFRVAALFGPSEEVNPKENNPKRKYAKRSEKFPLGDTIISILKSATQPMVVGDFMAVVPRKFTLSIWGAVLGKLVKRGKVKVVPLANGKKSYKLA